MELRLALRRIVRRPTGSAAVVMALALAVAITSALFSVLDGLLFRQLPFRDPDQSRDPLPIIISHDLWKLLFKGDPGILGVRELAGRPVRIIGVMGHEVKFPGETNVWAPVSSTRGRPPTYVRLARDATIVQLAGVFPELRFTSL